MQLYAYTGKVRNIPERLDAASPRWAIKLLDLVMHGKPDTSQVLEALVCFGRSHAGVNRSVGVERQALAFLEDGSKLMMLFFASW